VLVVLEVVEPSGVVEPDCVVELESLGDCAVPGVVEVVEPVGEIELSLGSSSLVPVPAPVGVAPPPPFIVDVPPEACDFSLIGTVTVVVEVVTVVGADPECALETGVTRVWGLSDAGATAGAASSGAFALEDVTAGAVGCLTWWFAGATRAARAC